MTPYYQDDAVTIYHGEALAVLACLPSSSAGTLITDPPYSSGGMFRADRTARTSDKYGGFSPGQLHPTRVHADFGGDSRDQHAYAYWSTLWLSEALRIVIPTGLAFVFTDWRQMPTTSDALQAGGWIWRGLVVWDKGVARPIQGRFRTNVEFCVWGSNGTLPAHAAEYPSSIVSAAPPSNREHATQKPIAVINHLLRIAPPGAAVLDPFMGSGTTLVAAKAAGRRAVGIEIEERYCEIAARRCAQEVLAL